MKEELNRKRDLFDSLSNSLKTELDKPERSLMRIAHLEDKIELLNVMTSVTGSEITPQH